MNLLILSYLINLLSSIRRFEVAIFRYGRYFLKNSQINKK